MSIVYLDTSALLKHYVSETGSNWVNALLSNSSISAVFISHLTVVETTCAFSRRLRDGTVSSTDHSKLLAAFNYDAVHRYNTLDVTSAIINTACRFAEKHPLRAYDAVQLASAWLSNHALLQTGKLPLTFICADDRLVDVAQAEGLPTDNPNHHS